MVSRADTYLIETISDDYSTLIVEMPVTFTPISTESFHIALLI
jgi:hypothetical protein